MLQLAFSCWPPLQALFGTASPDAAGWLLALGAGVLVMLLVELEKWLMRRLQPHRHPQAMGAGQPRSQ
ncbi:hypothetical protein D3C78_1929180 [compost metagenome]